MYGKNASWARQSMLAAMSTVRSVEPLAGLACAMVLLAGCAGSSAVAPTPTATASANLEACKEFASVTVGMADALNADDINAAWGDVRAEMDAAALKASGDVKDRLDDLVDEWPRGADLWVYQDFDAINTMLKDVGRACEADKADVEVYTFTTK